MMYRREVLCAQTKIRYNNNNNNNLIVVRDHITELYQSDSFCFRQMDLELWDSLNLWNSRRFWNGFCCQGTFFFVFVRSLNGFWQRWRQIPIGIFVPKCQLLRCWLLFPKHSFSANTQWLWNNGNLQRLQLRATCEMHWSKQIQINSAFLFPMHSNIVLICLKYSIRWTKHVVWFLQPFFQWFQKFKAQFCRIKR